MQSFLPEQVSITIDAGTVAWYGAILSTVSIIYLILNYYRDRVKLKIEFNRGIYIKNSSQYNPAVPYIEVKITNRGRRPAYISSASLKVLGMKGKMFLADSVVGARDFVIDEKKPFTSMYVEESLLDNKEVYAIWVIDGQGYRHTKYVHPLPIFQIIRFHLQRFWSYCKK